jgi:hypothetical protein
MDLMSFATTAATQDKPRAGYRWYVGDLRTGKISRTIDLIGASWSVPLGDAGSLEGSFPIRSGEWPSARSDAAVTKAYLAVAYVDAAGDETFLEGGPIWKSDFDDVTGEFQIGAAGLASYFDHRKVIPVLAAGDNPATATVTYTGEQRGLIAKRLVELAQSHTGANLPIVLPDDADLGGAGTKYTQTYPGYELGWVGERLKQLSELGATNDESDGPEIQFVPRRRSDDPRFIEWVMRIGTEPSMMLTQAGPAWVFDRTVPKSPVRAIKVSSDGTQMAFRQWAAGQGEAEGRPIVWDEDMTLVDLGFPLLESEVTATDTVSTTETLHAHATGALAFSQRPVESWALTVSRDTRPSVAQYAPGDWATVRVKDHVFIPAGDYSMRILSVAGDTSDAVTLTLSERLGDI